MADVQGAGGMTAAKFQIAYDGDALRNHTMDVQQLAPAMLAFGNLLRESNRQINGEKAKVNLLVSSDLEHKCFAVTFDLVLSFYDQIKTFLKHEDVQTAKEILEWIGLLGIPSLGSYGLYEYLRIKRGRKVTNITRLEDHRETGNLAIVFEGDSNTVVVNQIVYDLSENKKVTRAVAGTLAPLGAPGVNTLEFRKTVDGVEAKLAIREDAARDIEASCAPLLAEATALLEDPQTIRTHLQVYAPVFDPKAEHWRFYFGDQIIYADIRDTSIAADAIARGGAAVGDTYRVNLQIVQHETQSGRVKADYKILEVLEFRPSPIQPDLFDSDEVAER
jgi:hypothetical protein